MTVVVECLYGQDFLLLAPWRQSALRFGAVAEVDVTAGLSLNVFWSLRTDVPIHTLGFFCTLASKVSYVSANCNVYEPCSPSSSARSHYIVSGVTQFLQAKGFLYKVA